MIRHSSGLTTLIPACGEHGTNFGPGQREEFEPPCSIFGAVHRHWCAQIRIWGPAEHNSFDSQRFFYSSWRARDVSTQCPSAHGDQAACQRARACAANSCRCAASPLPVLCVLRGILGRDFGTHQALSEEHGAGVCGRDFGTHQALPEKHGAGVCERLWSR